MFEIEIYKAATGKEPYIDWEKSLDKTTSVRVDARLTRIRETGNLGIYEFVGNGVFELKLDFGAGYRIYFGFKTNRSLLLLFGGSKKSQQKDINKAKEYWEEHLSLTKTRQK